jgi:tRNA-splicing ligase RtcB (3'-phosphate/5'-hydroxy nucleic acid ligase)
MVADRRVTPIGADGDESPMAYRRLPQVIAQHADTVPVLHTLRPFAVAMASVNLLPRSFRSAPSV